MKVTPYILTKESAMLPGNYFLGSYEWDELRVVTGAKVIAMAPQGAPTELTLEVGGHLTCAKLIIPSGEANAEVSGSAENINVVVPAGSTARWKVTSGPTDPGAAASSATITMRLM